jgi:hypothetical protein
MCAGQLNANVLAVCDCTENFGSDSKAFCLFCERQGVNSITLVSLLIVPQASGIS